jgi:SAM-dependent methyltransferase
MGHILNKHKIFESDRIKVTEKIIRDLCVKNVLEIGAGDYSFRYLKSHEEIYWITVDFSTPCDIVCDLNTDKLVLPFADESFDLIICTEVIEHLLWPQNLLMEAYRILKDSGNMLVSVPNITSLSYRVAWMLGHIPSCAASGNLPSELGSTTYELENGKLLGGHVIDFNLKKITTLLQFAKFKIKRISGTGIIWHKQILPYWFVPASLSSNIICLAGK